MIFILNELESVEYLRQWNSSLFLTSINLNANRQRLFNYALIGKQCNSTWTIFEKIDLSTSSLERVDLNLSLCTMITYPALDVTTVDDSGRLFFFLIVFERSVGFLFLGWRTLRIVLFVLLGVVLAAAAALIAFFVIRFVEFDGKESDRLNFRLLELNVLENRCPKVRIRSFSYRVI